MTDTAKTDRRVAGDRAKAEAPGTRRSTRAEAARDVSIAAQLPAPRRLAIGVDVGGSGIKAAAVDLDAGALASTRHRVATPRPSSPPGVIRAIARLVRRIVAECQLPPDAPVGIGFPAVVIDGVTKTAANIDAGWVEFDADAALERVLSRPVWLVNDADAAGIAEMRFGAGVGERGTVIVITLGTGTGSALFHDGTLVPNSELGHMEIRGRDAEKRSAAAARVRRGLSWKAWAADLDEHLAAIDRLFWPRLFIVGGGVSKRADRFLPRLTVRPPVVPATLLNDAGIVGAALRAADRTSADRTAVERPAEEQPAATRSSEPPASTRAPRAGEGEAPG